MFSLSRPNRWGLAITTRGGLGVAVVANSRAPRFDFGPHFVVDVFLDFFGSARDVRFLSNTVRYDIEYYESPDTQLDTDAKAVAIDTQMLRAHLVYEIDDLQRFIDSDETRPFFGDPAIHVQTMQAAVVFIETNCRTPLFLVAYYSD